MEKSLSARMSPGLAVTLFTLIFCVCGVGRLNAGQNAKPSDAPKGNAENGRKLFTNHGCYECHGREGQGSSMTGPRIAPDPVPFEEFSRYIRRPTGEMPPYSEKVVPEQELPDLYAYLQTRAHPPASAKESPIFK